MTQSPRKISGTSSFDIAQAHCVALVRNAGVFPILRRGGVSCCATIASASLTRWGGTVGVGFEYGFAPNWSFGAEYDHLFMGNSNNSFSAVNPIVAGALNRINQDVDLITLRINYRFGWDAAPVTARY